MVFGKLAHICIGKRNNFPAEAQNFLCAVSPFVLCVVCPFFFSMSPAVAYVWCPMSLPCLIVIRSIVGELLNDYIHDYTRYKYEYDFFPSHIFVHVLLFLLMPCQCFLV